MDDVKRSNSTPNATRNRTSQNPAPTRSATTPIPPESFYPPSKQAPPLPKRQSSVGSSHTSYLAPTANVALPSYSSSWREPELVPEDDPGAPSLVPSEVDTTSGWGSSGSGWGNTVDSSYKDPWPESYDNSGWVNSTTSPIFGKTAGGSGPLIDGRDEDEEKEWWNANGSGRPGRGMLPPLLADKIHHPDHSLFMVSVTPPDLKPTSSTQPSPSAPTAQEVLEAIPHPHAYYCRKHNGWVLLVWKSSSILPPLVDSSSPVLPDRDRRKRTHSCLDEQPFGPSSNTTHHFHLYEQAVDAAHLNPAFGRREWERDALRKDARRRVTVIDDITHEQLLVSAGGDIKMNIEHADVAEDIEANKERDLLDLYVCCQCSFYVVVSDVIPGVIPSKYMDEFTAEKARNPTVGRTGEQAVVLAWDVVLTIIENKLWKGNSRSLSVTGKAFLDKVGWSRPTRKIFDALGFSVLPSEQPGAGEMLTPPSTDSTTPDGSMNRARLLRGWIEIGAMLVDYQRRFPNSIMKDRLPHKLWVKAESARESYQTGIGAHPDQIPRGGLPAAMHGMEELNSAWEKLGMTPTSFGRELLQFAYLAQCRCDPAHTLEYYSALDDIVRSLKSVGDAPHELETLLAEEQSRGRFSTRDLFEASRILGFGADNLLRVEFEDDVPEDFIAGAWRDHVRRSWAEGEAGARKRRDLNEAFRIIAEVRGSKTLWRMWEEEHVSGMTPEKAYSTLEVPEGVDEEMLLTVYGMRVEDQPSQLNKMKDALRVIAEFTGSTRLKKFMETGIDPGATVTPMRSDWPRGLNQLGNTCYLNSLLQYFYTIKDLREAVAPLAAASDKFVDDGKLNDDDLKNHRVGGRMVTRREVIRSRKFVSQLAALFWHLEWSEAPAVTPSMELAKLALVTSKDEEEDDHDGDRGGTDSSHSTDATLVDESVSQQQHVEMRKSSSPTTRSPSSVLGKRSRGTGRRRTDADATMREGGELNKDKDGFVLVDKPVSPLQLAPPALNTPNEASVAMDERDGDGDIQMADSDQATGSVSSKAPPLPPRPKRQASTSDMMFGKQHDVAECMDNCMFQIETALLELGELAMSDSGDNMKRSVVKRLFYGKIRQRLSMQVDTSKAKSSIHERQDFFSHLPVNVSEESFDLYDGLSGYFDDVVDFEGKKARMEVALVELPPILQIQLQRVQFNRETLQPYKSHAYVKFGETISMDRFLDDAPADKKATSKNIQMQLNNCRDRIHALTQGTYAPYTESLENTSSFLAHQECIALPEVDPELLSQLKREEEVARDEISECRARASELKERLEQIWSEETRAEYELTSVFVHRGASPSFGHYFIYQRWLPDSPDSWFKYNDSDVSIVTKEEVLADTTGSTANPYLLVFARKESQVIHTVQRTDPMAIEAS